MNFVTEYTEFCYILPKPIQSQRMKPHNIANLILIGICSVLSGLSFSLLSPFYPSEALSKGVSMTQSGLVFGSMFITTVLVTPMCGKYHHVAGGAKIFLLIGSFICAFGNISFGILDRVNSSSVFLALSLIIRIITAAGEGAVQSSVFTLAAQQGTKEDKGKLMSMTETCFGVGTIFGPSVGGFLYQVGGFSMPFWICGGIFLMCSLMAVFLFKDALEDEAQTPYSYKIGWCQLLCVPAVPISVLSLIVASSSFNWYSVSLAPFLSLQYGLTAAQCGLFFMILGLCYTLFTPLFGFLMDWGLDGLSVLVMGNFFITVGLIFMGPIPQLEAISGNLWLTGLAIGLQGVGYASTNVGTLIYMSTSSIAAGLPDNEPTQGMVSSVWIVADCLGGYMGSTVGGLAADQVGFRAGTLIQSSLVAVSVLVLLGLVAWRCYSRNFVSEMKKKQVEDARLKQEEKKKLLWPD